MSNIEVILIQDVAKYGKKGELIKVPSGFANFLVSQNKARIATASEIAKAQSQQKQKQARQQQTKEQIKKAVSELVNNPPEIKLKANEQGHLFESIPGKKLAKMLQEWLNAPISEKCIQLDEPIKTVGHHSFKFDCDNVTETIVITINPEQE